MYRLLEYFFILQVIYDAYDFDKSLRLGNKTKITNAVVSNSLVVSDPLEEIVSSANFYHFEVDNMETSLLKINTLKVRYY